ncbi:MAG: hypothetical protein JKY56_20190 [Kofleriaceae bacterium]|nr:hypothetical protein [Kofleriaceae bacterium]
MPNTIKSVLVLLFGFLLLAGPSPAQAKDFVTMPEATGAEKNIQIRFVKYDGSTNGEMVVQVKNTGKTTANFRAEGLFFVPQGSPEKAPQRLGASGPFTESGKRGKRVHQEKLALAPGESKTLRLEVFCIDSHRSSPSSNTQFSLAKNKLPKKMQETMKSSNQAIYKKNKGSLRKSKSAVQSNMWKVRDADWVKLEGERAVEKAPRNGKRRHPMQNRIQQRNLPPQSAE